MGRTKVEGECIVYTGFRNPTGYGHTRYGLAHRVVWAHHHPENPAPEAVMHSCDNPPCINIAHLAAGTRLLNSRDMAAKGRSARMRGEKSGMAKLTSDQVSEIRARSSSGEKLSDIAAIFGIHPAHVSRIVNHKRRQFDGQHPQAAIARGFMRTRGGGA